MATWRLITHHSDPEAALRWSEKTGRIAIGWGDIGSIDDQNYTSPDELMRAVKGTYPTLANYPFSGTQLWALCHQMKLGDLVILSTGNRRALVVEVAGPYEYRLPADSPLGGDYRHQRRIKRTALNADEIWRKAGSKPAPGQNIRWTLVKCLRSVE